MKTFLIFSFSFLKSARYPRALFSEFLLIANNANSKSHRDIVGLIIIPI